MKRLTENRLSTTLFEREGREASEDNAKKVLFIEVLEFVRAYPQKKNLRVAFACFATFAFKKGGTLNLGWALNLLFWFKNTSFFIIFSYFPLSPIVLAYE